MQKIKLEPHNVFKNAIIKVDAQGRITYGYYLLVDVTRNFYNLDLDDAIEWVEYNILNLSHNGFSVSYNQNVSSIYKPRLKAASASEGKWRKRKLKKS